jgi:hypothetical protein
MPVSIKIGERSYVHDVEIDVDPKTLKDAPLAPDDRARVEEAIEKGEMLRIQQRLSHTEDILYEIPGANVDGDAVEENVLLDNDAEKPCRCYKMVVKKKVDPASLLTEIESTTGFKLHAATPGDSVNGFWKLMITKDGHSIIEIYCYDFNEPPDLAEKKAEFVKKANFSRAKLKTVLQAHK